MALAFAHRGVLWIVLDEENHERIAAYDPFDFDGGRIGDSMSLRMPLQVVVAYAKREEYETLVQMSPDDMVAHLRRGYRELPSDFARGAVYANLTHSYTKKKS